MFDIHVLKWNWYGKINEMQCTIYRREIKITGIKHLIQ